MTDNIYPVLCTTEFKGVFFGFVIDCSNLPESIKLKDAVNCIYWSEDCKGFMGLAAYGPTKDCKIGAKVEELILYKITSVSKVSDEALERWKERLI
jgi:hypothetical protein